MDCVNSVMEIDTTIIKANDDMSDLTSVNDSSKHSDHKIDNEQEVTKIHFLRCFECGFESVDQFKFDTHMPCVMKDPPVIYAVYKCCICSTISTSKLIMEEHKQIYHKEEDKMIIKEFHEQLKIQLLIGESRPNDPKKCLSLSSTNFQSNNSQMKFLSPNVQNGTEFSNQMSKLISSKIDFSNRSKPVELPNHNSKPLIDCLITGWQKPTINSSVAPYSKRDSLIPNLYNYAVISSMIQKQQNQHSPLGVAICSLCKISFQNQDDLTKHVYFFHNHFFNQDPNILMTALMSSNSSFLKDLQVPASLQPCILSNPLWMNSLKLKSQYSNIISQMQFPLACPICRCLFFNFVQMDAHITQVHSNGTMNLANNFMKAANVNGMESDSKQFLEINSGFYNDFQRRTKIPKSEPLDCMSVIQSNSLTQHCQDGENNNTNKSIPQPKRQSTSDDKITSTSSNSDDAFDSHDLQNAATSPNSIFSNLKQTPQSQMIVHNTMRKTKSDLKVINRFLSQVKNEHRPVQEIPPEELNLHLQDFVQNAKKKDGHEYEPESLKAFVHSLERYLKTFHNYPVSVLKDQQFNSTRTMLHQRLQELRLKSKSINNQNSINPISKYSINQSSQSFQDLFKYDIIGHETPQALINTLWLINRVLFHIGGVHKHKNLLWGQFSLTKIFGQTCLQYYPSKINFVGPAIKDLEMELFNNKDSDSPVSITSGDSRLPVNAIEIFQIYANMRPLSCRNMTDPFYLCSDPTWKKGGSWFKAINAGFQYISKIPRLMGFKTSNLLKNPINNHPLSRALSSSTTKLPIDSNVDLLDFDSSQIIDIDSQTIDDHNHSSASSSGVSVFEHQASNGKDILATFDGDEQSEAMDMSAKLCH